MATNAFFHPIPQLRQFKRAVPLGKCLSFILYWTVGILLLKMAILGRSWFEMKTEGHTHNRRFYLIISGFS